MLGKKYKMSMDDSLRIVQKLYEEGYLTYPRTNSEYLATAEKDRVKSILSGVSALGYPVEFKDKKTIFDDSKIESHSALTPDRQDTEAGRADRGGEEGISDGVPPLCCRFLLPAVSG